MVCGMQQSMSLPEALHAFGLLGRALPRFVTSVSGSGDTLEIVADPRAVRNLPAALKLATRVVPAVHARLRVVSFADGVATLAVDASAGGLPAHKLLSLASSRIDAAVTARRLPYGSVRVLPGAQIALDVQRLVAEKHPGYRVRQMAFYEGAVWLDVEPTAAVAQA